MTFTWTPGFGATSYQFSIGTTPGGSDVVSAVTGNALSYAADLGCQTQTQALFVTLGSMINGQWQTATAQYAGCQCDGFDPSPGPGPSYPSPAFQLVSSEPNIQNNGQPQTGTTSTYQYQLVDLNSPSDGYPYYLSASNIEAVERRNVLHFSVEHI